VLKFFSRSGATAQRKYESSYFTQRRRAAA